MNKKSYRNLIVNLKQGNENEEIEDLEIRVEIFEDVKVRGIIHKIEQYVKEALVERKIVTEEYICVLPEGSYEYEVDEDDNFLFLGEFDLYIPSYRDVGDSYSGYVSIRGEDIDDESVYFLDMMIFDLKKE